MDTLNVINQAQNGDETAREKLVLENTGLIWSVVKRFLNRGYEKEDLFQIGCIGLLKAIDRFDTEYNVTFSTYAVPLIMGEIRRFLRDDGIIKISRSIKENQYKIIKKTEELQKQINREPTVEELAVSCELTVEEVLGAMEAAGRVESLYKENDEQILMDRVQATPSPENEIVDKLLLSQALESLEKEEKKIIILRYFKNKTQSETGKLLNKTQVQISRMEKRILLELRGIIQQ